MARKDASPLPLAALITLTLFAGVFALSGGFARESTATPVAAARLTGSAGTALKAGPMAFEPVGGGSFITRGKGYAVAIGSQGPTMTIGPSAVSLKVEGGRRVTPAPSGRQQLVVNRYTGHTARTGIPTFSRVTYAGVLAGIDLRYHGRAGQLEYDFALRPHADPGAIGMRVDGARSVRLAGNGDLLMQTEHGILRQHKPVAFQDGRRVPVRFSLKASRLSFRLARYDRSKPLVIDPHLSLSDYIGGTGLDAATKVAVDSAGNIYIVGTTNSSSIPGGSGSTSTPSDAFVARLGPDGSRQWLTYLAGNDVDTGLDIALDGSGRPYVVGSTKSTNFPTTAGVAQSGLVGGEDGFVTALTTTGTVRYSTYNGSGIKDISQGLAVTPSGIVYTAVSSGTTEMNGQLNPTTGYVIVLNATATAATAKNFHNSSGLNADSVSSVGLVPGCDAMNCTVYMAGHTVETGPSKFLAYVYKWSFATNTSPWGGYFTYSAVDGNGNPSNGDNDVAALAMDPNGNPTIIGTVFLPGNVNYAYVARFRGSDGATENPGFTYDSTKVGGTSNGTDIAYDAQGNLYSLATTTGSNGVKTDAVQPDSGGAYDGILLKFAPAAFTTPGPNQGSFVWQSFIGGTGGDFALGVTTDSHGGTYVVGETGSGGWLTSPTTQAKSSGDDGFLWKIQTNSPTITDGPSGTVASHDVTFKYTTGETDGAIECRLISAGSSSAFGSCGSGPSGSHTFSGLADGDYTFEVHNFDSGGTTSGETTTRAFKVDTAPHASFTIAPNPALVGRTVSFDASASSAATAITKYEWDLDGNGSFESNGGTAKTISMTYPAVGSVTVGLRITDGEGRQATATNALTITSSGTTGQAGVTINNGAQYTNDPNVMVTATFPSFTTNLLFSNDGGFGKAQTFPAKKETPWKLDSSGPERLPKTIYVRFLTGSLTGETHQDDIILDETPPTLAAAQVTPVGAASPSGAAVAAKLRSYTVKTKASDKTSGVGKIQATSNKKKPGKAQKYKKKVTVKSSKRPVWVRVRDRAGNWSKWKRSR